MRVDPSSRTCISPLDTCEIRRIDAKPGVTERIEIERLAGRQLPRAAPSPAPPAKPGLGDRIGQTAGELFSGLLGSLTGLFSSLAKAGRNLLSGEVGKALVNLVSIPANAAALLLLKTISAVQTAIFIQDPGRPLSSAERELLGRVFKNSLNLDAIRLVEGGSGLLNLGNAGIAVGNTIHIPGGKPFGLDALVHEATHVWQSQNGGNDYLLRALGSQETEGYDVRLAAFSGASWESLNREQQAELLEVAQQAGYFDAPGKSLYIDPEGKGHATPVRDAIEATALLQDGLSKLRRGVGTD